ncbi:MAG: hypothetical protein ACM3PZ_03450 [Bacillota bacterium]
MQEERLFTRQLFSVAAADRRARLSWEIAQLRSPVTDEFIESLVRRYMYYFPAVSFDRAGIQGGIQEVYHIQSRHDSVWGDEYVDVDEAFLRFEVAVPFEGDGDVLLLCPTIFYREAEGLEARLSSKRICLHYEIRKAEKRANLAEHYKDDLAMLEKLIMNLKHDVDIYNGLLPRIIRDMRTDLAKA